MFTQNQPPKFLQLFISPGDNRLRTGWRLLLHMLILFLFVMIIGFIVGIGILVTGIQVKPSLEAIPKIVEILITLPSILLATIIARTVLDQRTFKSLGFGLDRRMLVDLLAGFLIAGLLMALIFLFEWRVGWLQIDSLSWQIGSSSKWLLSLLGGLAYFAIIGFQEELIFRGYQMQNLIEAINLPGGLLLSSALFAFAHLLNPHASLLSTLGIFASGLFLAYGWIRTHQLWLSIGLHIGWNFFEGSVFGFPVSGTDITPLISAKVVGPELLSGGAFGPEAGIILLPTLALGAFLIWLYTKSRLQENEDPSLADMLFGTHNSH